MRESERGGGERGGVVQQRGDGRGKNRLDRFAFPPDLLLESALCGKGTGAPGPAAGAHLVLLTA